MLSLTRAAPDERKTRASARHVEENKTLEARSRMSTGGAHQNRTTKEHVSRMRGVLFSSSQQDVSFVRTTAILFRKLLLTSCAMSTEHGCGSLVQRAGGGGAHDGKWGVGLKDSRIIWLLLFGGACFGASDYGECRNVLYGKMLHGHINFNRESETRGNWTIRRVKSCFSTIIALGRFFSNDATRCSPNQTCFNSESSQLTRL
jgi:hypothetical protein